MLKRHKNHFVFSCSIKAVARLADERGGKKKRKENNREVYVGRRPDSRGHVPSKLATYRRR